MLFETLTWLPLIAGAVTRDEEEFVTELRHVPEGWLAVAGFALLAAVCWAVVWMYRHEGRIGASSRVRGTLAVIRCLVLLLLAVILLEPVRVRILRRWIDSYTVVLVDDSSSMDLVDTYRDDATRIRVSRLLAGGEATSVRRSDVVHQVLERDERSLLRDLAKNNRIKLFGFSDEPTLHSTIRAAREKPADDTASGGAALAGVLDVATDFSATGSATNIERAVRRAVESLGSAPVAGVVVLTDGGFNQGAPVERVAAYARDRRLPVHVVGVGDPSRPYNVRVTEILAPPNAFQRDPFSVSAQLSADGLDGRTVEVRLRERDASGGQSGRVVETRNVLVKPGGAMEPVSFLRRESEVGRFVYTVEVAPLEGESVTDDNSKQATVNVIDSRTRVLIVAGEPSWEYRFVSRLLQRDDTFDVSCWLQSADQDAVRDGDTIIDHFPDLAEELFEYDVVILMDPNETQITEQWCRLVDTLVTEYGGGLLLAAARPHTPALMRDRSLKPLHDLLPVTIDPEADIVLNEIGHYQAKPSPVEVPTTALGHPIMRLADDPVSGKLLWQRINEVFWHYPVLREKPVATVLMRHGSPRMTNKSGGHVLAAVQFVGAGRTGFLGFDGTWRWRRRDAAVFDRFWVQFVRYLAEGKLLGGTKRGMLVTDSDQFSLGEAVTVSARLLDRQYEPIVRDQWVARYAVEDQRGEFVLGARRDRPGWYEGRFVPDRIGSYRISVNVPQPGDDDPTEVTREIRVTRPNIEILRPQMDRASLTTLAEQSAGGRYFEVDEAAELAAAIPDLHEEIPIRSRPTTLWDNWKVLTLLLTLLTVEWAVRKWNRLL